MNGRTESKSQRDRRLVGWGMATAFSCLIWWGAISLVGYLISGAWKDSWIVEKLSPYETEIIVLFVFMLISSALVVWVLWLVYSDFRDSKAFMKKIKRKYKN